MVVAWCRRWAKPSELCATFSQYAGYLDDILLSVMQLAFVGGFPMNFFGCTAANGAARIAPHRKSANTRPSDISRRGLNRGDECAPLVVAVTKPRVLIRVRKDSLTEE